MVVLMYVIIALAICSASFIALAAHAARNPHSRQSAELSRLDRMDGLHTEGRRSYHGRHSAHTPRHVA